MSQSTSIGVREYYRKITDIDIGEIARELLNGRITQSSKRILLCDCPHHQSQSKRSLNIMLDKQSWYCFGCGVGGDVLQLVEFLHTGAITRGQSGRMPESHREARDFLAQRAGMPPLSRAGLSPEAIEEMEQDRRKNLRVFEALTQIAEYYHRRLLAHPDALKWFRRKYRIGDEMIAHLKIGFAENGVWTDSAGSPQGSVLDELCTGPQAFTYAELSATSAFQPCGSSIRPFFNRRIIFPYWSRGRVVSMIGRKTPATPGVDWEHPKYKKLAVHNPEKRAHVAACISNDVLYNEDVLSTRPERLVITEGVTDCISLMEHGFGVISPVTLEIKDGDWDRIIPKLVGTTSIHLCYDNELSEAGLQGALRTAQKLTEKGIVTRVAILPLGEKQQNARRQLKERFGLDGPASPLGAGEPETRSEEDASAIAELREQAKIDVNEYFAGGGTAAGFEAILASAQTPLALSISRIRTDISEAELDRELEPILTALVPLSPVEQEGHIRQIQRRFGRERITLEALRKQLQFVIDVAPNGKVKPFPGPERTPQVSAENASGLPNIQTGDRQLRDMVAEAWAAVHSANQPDVAVFATSPYVFRRGPNMVYLADRNPLHEIEEMGEAVAYGVIARAADWYKGDGNVIPMKEVARDMLAFVDTRLPQLDAVLRTPVFGHDGSLIVAPGYHETDHVWMDVDPTLQLAPLSGSPTSAETQAARDLIDEMLVDFPFKDPSDRAHVIAALILPFVRRMIGGPTPNHLVEAPGPAAGKGLLVNTIGIVATGERCESRTLPESEDEIRKMITAELMRARPILLLDNASERRTLHSPSLASVLTTVTWTDRVLGASQMVSVPNQGLWLTTGNNPRLDTELVRRCIRIRIVPKSDRPWLRKDFKHPDLVEWVKTNRSAMVHAVLTLVLGWIAAGKPKGEQRLGSFEQWSEVIGGILDVAKINGFLTNLEQLYEQADQAGQKWREFITAWWTEFKDGEKQVADLNAFCERLGLIPEVRGDGTPRSQQVRLGNALSNCRDKRFGSFAIEKVAPEGNHNGVSHYRLVDNELQ